MKKYLLLLVPPIVIIFLKKLQILLHQLKNTNEIDDYANEALTKMVVEKNEIFNTSLNKNKTVDLSSIRSILGVCVAGINNNKNELNVLDFGGGGGYHYFISKLVIGQNLKINWAVVETESMARAAKRLSNSELKFFSSINDASFEKGKIDIFFASSSLQYCSNQKEIIENILKVEPDSIFITRTPFSESEPVHGKKQFSKFSSNGPGPLPKGYKDSFITYPIYIMNVNEFIEKFREKYDLKFQIREEAGAFTVGNNSYDNYGFYFTLKNSTQNK